MKSDCRKILCAGAALVLLSSGCTAAKENKEALLQKESSIVMSKPPLRTDAPALRFPAIIPIYGNDDENLTNTRALIKHLHETAHLTEFAVCFPDPIFFGHALCHCR